MPFSNCNGVRLYAELHGKDGVPVVLVHGSWGDHHNWDAVVPSLARMFCVLTYDRRGHSQSERVQAQGSVDDDVDDLAELIATSHGAPAHVVASSFGAIVALNLAVKRPDLFASLAIHEPPLIGLLGNDPVLSAVQQRIGAVVATLQSGQTEWGAQQFVETVALGPGRWAQLSPEMQQTFIFNAPTWLDEMNEPGAFTLDLERLARFHQPALISRGDQSPPFFGAILERIAAALPQSQRNTFRGAGHIPHLTHPDEFASVVSGFINAATV
jgi:pimeloyl-ACP methyl ester carboxylesterase